jgi:O-antigen ligase
LLFVTDSGAAVLGAVAGAVGWLFALFWQRISVLVIAAGLLSAFTFAPILGDVAAQVLPSKFVDGLEESHARDRIHIWQSFGAAASKRLVLGTGFGTSPVLAHNQVASEIPVEHRLLLGAGHPHNGYLQLWVELGGFGVAAALYCLYLLVRKLEPLTNGRLRASLAVLAASSAIMLVGHGAWQGWWIASLAASAIWLSRYSEGEYPGRRLDALRSDS